MKKIIVIFIMLVSSQLSAQTTAIPDPAFEQELINQNIDSDGIVNGQVLTSDVENVTVLIMEDIYTLEDLTGIQSFINLEELSISFSGITAIDVSQNTQLKILNCRSNSLTSIDVSQNVLLEHLDVGNAGDVGPWNEITEIDLSNNPNIKSVGAATVPWLNSINLQNGNNNEDMTLDLDMWFDGASGPDTVICVQVDDEELAQNNQFPYSEWVVQDIDAVINYSENCALSTQNFTSNNTISIYPNPTSDMLYFNTNGDVIDKAILYDISGRVVKKYRDISNAGISVAGLAKGMYVVQISSGKNTQTEKIIVE